MLSEFFFQCQQHSRGTLVDWPCALGADCEIAQMTSHFFPGRGINQSGQSIVIADCRRFVFM